MNIIFFDSGIGGLSVLHQAQSLLPNLNYIYFGDSQNNPYGTKSNSEIQTLTTNAIQSLINIYNPTAIVIACNTATSVAISHLRATFPTIPILGMEPAIKPATQNQQKAIITATDSTIKNLQKRSQVQTLLDSQQIQFLSLQKLVQFAEQNDFSSPDLKQYLKTTLLSPSINWNNHSSIVLGCTHYIFFKNLIQSLLPHHITIHDGVQGTVTHLQNILHNLNILNSSIEKHPTKTTFIFSGKSTQEAETIGKNYLQLLDSFT